MKIAFQNIHLYSYLYSYISGTDKRLVNGFDGGITGGDKEKQRERDYVSCTVKI